MLFKCLRVVAAAIAMLALRSVPASAHNLHVEVTAKCGCVYSITASGQTDANASVVIRYSFTVTSTTTHLIDYPVSGQILTTTDANGFFSETLTGLSLPGDCLLASTLGYPEYVTLTNGSSSLTVGNSPVPEIPDQFINFGSPQGGAAQYLYNCPLPTGKSFDIGPSSMEGHLLIRAGDWISGGYSFVFVSGSHPATTVTVSSTLTLPFKCPDGTASQFVINLGTHDYSVPAGDKNWQPTGDANNVLSWAGAGQAPAGCGPGAIMDNSKGAIWTATITQNPDTGSLLNWRFKYRDPNAKGKGNVNCLDLSDPRRNKADVCGASWSETVKDP